MKTHHSVRSAVAATFFAALAGCGGPPPIDAQGQALAETAAQVAVGLEGPCTSASFFTGIDLSRGADAAAIRTAADVINGVFAGCIHAVPDAAPATGITVGFGDKGCGIPFTPLQFAGSLGVHFGAPGTNILVLRFAALRLLDLAIDGELDLASGRDSFSWTMSDLRVSAPHVDVLLHARGTLRAAKFHTAVVFDGDGFIGDGEQSTSFVARGLLRDLRDCYPSEGTLAATIAPALLPPATLTLRFNSDTSGGGKVKLDWDGHDREWYLPSRGCMKR